MPSISIPAIGTAIAGGLTDLGIGATTAGILGSVGSAAITGAGIGGLTSALTGGKVLKGMGYGALAGGALGAGGALAGAFPETAASIGLGPSAGGVVGDVGGAASGFPSAVDVTPEAFGSAPGTFLTGAPDAVNITPEVFGSNPGGYLSSGSSGFGLNDALHAVGDVGNIAGALAGPAKPNFANAPGPATTAATRGALFDMPLPTSGFINRTPTPNYTPIGGDWYHYGEHGGQPLFWSNNQLKFPAMAKGGALSYGRARGGEGPAGHVRGPGTGTSDSITAALSDGEYVLSAGDVSRIGQGSTEAGVKKLDQMRSAIARDAGARKHQGTVKHPLQYLRRAGGRR